MQSDLPLLILADIPQDFALKDLTLSDQASTDIYFAPSQYENLDRLRAVTSGMAFDLVHYSADEITQSLADTDLQHIFCETPEKQLSGIGIALTEHISAAKSDGTINRALLDLARHIGHSIKASSIIWRPAQLHIGFDYFIGAIDHYIAGGPFPVLVQVAITQLPDGKMQTSGLSYFAGQEIRISAPSDYAPNEVVKRLVRIIHDIATNGKVEEEAVIDGFNAGERLSITPVENGQSVEIAITANGPR
ncbi:hypothetical protein [Parasphingorhabdus sp.]|uniref:hypothetical protein n=1 Tax=Parasphingorhabdus sp. TaxID=2709688 RepID=UPI002F945C14